jgi:hypothetical protein
MRRWVDWRAVVLALLFAVAAALPFMSSSVLRRDFYFFDATITSTSAGITQVFWDFGRGHSEYDSSRQPLKVEPVPVVYRYMLPMGKIYSLRFDPISDTGKFTISHARIVDDRGKPVREFKPGEFSIVQNVARLEPRGDTLYGETSDKYDPVLLLKFAEPLVLKSNARIWLKLGWPVAWKVFLVGFVLGLPAVSSRLLAAAAAIGRWVQRRPRVTLAGAAALFVAIQCHPVIFFGRSFASPNNGALMLYEQLPTLPGAADVYTDTMGSDVGALLFHHVYFPMVQHDALFRDHELPLWNRYTLGGGPSLGQGQSFFGNPFEFFTILANGAGWAWDVQFVLAHWLFAAGLGFIVWQLTRHLGAALLVTLGGTFISFYTFRINHPATFSVCYSPWILWAWIGFVNTRSHRGEAGWLCAWIAANWTVMTSGTVKEAYMIMVCLNLTGLSLLYFLPPSQGRRARRLALVTAAGVIFLLLSAPLSMSFLETLSHSYTVYDAPSASPFPLSHLLGLFDDIFFRQMLYDEVVAGPGLNFLLLLGVLWWLANPRGWRKDRAGLALGIAALVPLCLAFGIIPPAVIVQIPFIKNIHHVGNTFSCSLLTIVAVLAGCGFRDALTRFHEPKSWRTFAAMLIVGGLIAVPFFFSNRNQPLSPFFHGYAPAIAISAVALTMGVFWARGETSLRASPLVVALVLGLPLLLWRHSQFNDALFNRYAFVPGMRADFYASSASARFVDEQRTEPGRVVGWGNNLFPAYNTALRWEGLYGVETLRNSYYQELAKEFELTRVWVWDAPNEEKKSPLLLPIHDLLNVSHYVATPQPSPHQIAGLEFLASADFDVFRSPTSWPRAFFTDRLGVYGTPKDFVALVNQRDRRPFATVQNTEASIPSLSSEFAGRIVKPARDYRLTGNTTAFTVEASGPGVAVLTEAFYRDDFRVTLNEKPTTYFRVNHAFKGVYLPAAGTYHIVFEFHPPWLDRSLVLAALGLLLLIAGTILLVLADRRIRDAALAV